MGFRRLEESTTFQLAVKFKREIYAIASENPRAIGDLKYVGQLFDAASGAESCIAEGFHRFHAAELRQFLRYSIASLGEATTRLRDGVDRGYFTEARCATAFELGDQAIRSAKAWYLSLGPHTRRSPAPSRPARKPDC